MDPELKNTLCRDLEAFAARNIIESADEVDVSAHIDAYERLWEKPIGELIDSFGEQSVVTDIMYNILESKGIALSHDTEFIYNYRGDELSYEVLIERYADLIGKRLDSFSYEIRGDWDEQDDAHIVFRCQDVQIDEVAEYNSDWADTETLINLFNRCLSALGEPKRLHYIPVGEGTDTHIFYMMPEHRDFVKQYFQK